MRIEQLVQANLRGRTLVQLEAAARAEGPANVSRGRWDQLLNQELTGFPKPPTIATIANVLRVPVETVVLACAESMGLLRGPGETPVLLQLLDPREARALEEIPGAVSAVLETIHALVTASGGVAAIPLEPAAVVPAETGRRRRAK